MYRGCAVIALLALAWLALYRRVPWAGRCAVLATAGSLVGLMLYVPVLAFAPGDVAELTIALTLHLPLLTAAVFIWLARRSRPAPARRTAASGSAP